jgi:hypothetical protein
MRYETVKTLEEEFTRSNGVIRDVFEKILAFVQSYLRESGRPLKLRRAYQLLLTLMYWQEYRTEFHIGLTYGVSEATVSRTIKKVENVLAKLDEFRLPGKKVIRESDTIIEVIVVDVSEQPIELPKKALKHYNGEKKRHTQKSQVTNNAHTEEIICTAFGIGSDHDFRVFKESKIILAESIECLADREPAYRRILAVHVIRILKIFHILSERYRNKHKYFKLHFNLITASYNTELKHDVPYAFARGLILNL